MSRLCCRARHIHSVRAEMGYGEKVSQRLWSQKVEEGIGLTARHKDAQRPEGRRVFELERLVSCRSADPWWRTCDVTNALKHWKILAQRSSRDQASIKRSFAMPGIETWHLRSQTSITRIR